MADNETKKQETKKQTERDNEADRARQRSRQTETEKNITGRVGMQSQSEEKNMTKERMKMLIFPSPVNIFPLFMTSSGA